MHPSKVLKSIYEEHGWTVPRMAETLACLDVSREDVDLLARMPWQFLANRIAVEREKLGLSSVHPLLHWKLPPPPPDWLTPAVCQKMFALALEYQDDEANREFADPSGLILPA